MTSENKNAESRIDEFYDELYRTRPHAYITAVFITANVLMFTIAYAYDQLSVLTPNSTALLKWGAGYALLTTNGQWWRLISAAFIHFGIIHLAMNMICLYFAGSFVERFYRGGFPIIYLFSALAGNMTSLYFKGGSYIGCGASGAVFGVIGALGAILITQHKKIPVMILKPLRSTTILFVVFNLFVGTIIPQIDNAAHLGGLIGGFGTGVLLAYSIDDTKLKVRKVTVGIVLLVGAIAAVWSPVMNNSRKDALCRMAVKKIIAGERAVLKRVGDELIKPVEIQSELFQKAIILDELSQFWQHGGEALKPDKRPYWPLSNKEYELYYDSCITRVELLKTIARAMRSGMTDQLRDRIYELTEHLKHIQEDADL